MVYKAKNEKVAEFMNKMLPKKSAVEFGDGYVLIDIIVPSEEANYPEASKMICTGE